MKKLIATAALLLVLPMFASAQNANHQYRGQGYLFFAPGVAESGFGSRGIVHIGGGGEGLIYKSFGLGAELGDMFPWSNFYDWLAVGSLNMSYHFSPRTKSRKLEPFVAGGYTFFYVPGVGLAHANGGNFGCGANILLKKHAPLRLEVRDTIGGRNISIEYEPYGNFYTAPQNVVSFRIGMTFR